MRRLLRRRAALPGTASLDIRLALLSLTALLLVAPLAGCGGGSEIERVVMISIDTLRPDFLGCYDPERATTPNIDALAAEGAIFTDALAQGPSTAISHKSIFSSLYRAVHGTGIRRVPREEPVSPLEVMQRAGYRTAAFVGGGQLHPRYGFDKGFDEYNLSVAGDPRPLETLRERARGWLEMNRKEPFFLFLHTYQVHAPYDPPERYRERFAGWYEGDLDLSIKGWRQIYGVTDVGPEVARLIRDLYSAQIAYVDDFMGWLAEDLRELGLDDDTAIVFLSDHGQSLGEGGYWGHNRLHEVQLWIPLILKIPGLAPARIEAPVEAIDVMPTLFSLLGLEPPYPFQGEDLLPRLRGEAPWPAKRLRIAESGHNASVRDGEWKVVFKPRKRESGRLVRLHGLKEQRRKMAGSEVAGELRRHYQKMLSESGDLRRSFRGHVNPTRDAEVREQLEALGYIQ